MRLGLRRQSNRVQRATVSMVVASLAALGTLAAPLSSDLAPTPPATNFFAVGYFHSLPPARILDTRSTLGGLQGKVRPGQPISVQVTGVGGVPASGATAVVLNATVTEPTMASYLTLYPTGESTPVASNLNFIAGQTVPNQVVAKVGAGGKVDVFNAAGQTHVLLDVVGWYDSIFAQTASSQGSRLTSLVPTRILDTRSGVGASGKVGPGRTIDVKVRDIGGVPAAALAVVLNATVTEPSEAGYLTVFPSDSGQPVASNLNFIAGQTVPNMVIAKGGADGMVKVFNAAGSTPVIFDVVGWYGFAAAGAGIGWALTPARILDTRGTVGNLAGKLGAGGVKSVHVAGVGGVPAYGAAAAVLNVTVTGSTAPSYLTVYPSGSNRPVASALNFKASQTVPNLVLSQLGPDGNVNVFNAAGETDVVIDVVSWYDGQLAQPAGTGSGNTSSSSAATAKAQAGSMTVVRNALSIEQLRAHWTRERFAKAKPQETPRVAPASAAEDPFVIYDYRYEYPTVIQTVGCLFYDIPGMPENNYLPTPNVCSATVVGRNLLITAAHCVVSKSNRDGQTYNHMNFVFVPMENGQIEPNGSWFADTATYYQGYLTMVDPEVGQAGSFPPLDYACLTVPQQGNQNAYIGDATGFWPIKYYLNAGGAKYSVGYPAEGIFSNAATPPGYCSLPGPRPGDTAEWCFQHYCFAPLSKWKFYGDTWWTGGFGCKTSGGASGGTGF